MGYEKIRFIGYAVPTTPAEMLAVGDPNGSGAVAGTYRASSDVKTDVIARAKIMKHAVDLARETVAGGEEGVLNVFLAPEFFWHGDMGPYLHTPDGPDPAELILAELHKLFPVREYPDFLLVLGTMITAQAADIDVIMESSATKVRNDVVRVLGEGWNAADGPLAQILFDTLTNFIKNCHAYPHVEVRNRAFVLGPGELDGFDGPLGMRVTTTEKYYDSNEDLLLWDVTGKPVITEQMSAYPILDLSAGDLKKSARDHYAIFQVPPGDDSGEGDALTVGVEICLDHSDRRLRKGVARSRWPAGQQGGVDLHLIPSCGMQLHPGSVAAGAGGWAFNRDGQFALGDAGGEGQGRQATFDGVPCVYTDYVDPADSAYGAHTQLAAVRSGPRGDDKRAPGSRDAEFGDAPDVDVTVVAVPPVDGFDEYFAGGPGALHIYGLERPVQLG